MAQTTGEGLSVDEGGLIEPVISRRGPSAASRIAWLMSAADVLVLTMLGVCLVLAEIVSPLGAALLVVATSGAFAVRCHYATASGTDPAVLSEFRKIVGATLVGMVAALTAMVWIAGAATVTPAGTALLAGWTLGASGIILAVRWLIRRRIRARLPERVLIIGAGVTGQDIARRLRRTGQHEVVGFIDSHPYPLGEDLAEIPVIGFESDLALATAIVKPERIIVAFTRNTASEVLHKLRTSGVTTVPISIVPHYHEITPTHAGLSSLDGMPLVELRSADFSRGARVVKGAIDRTVALGLLVALSPALLAIAIAVKVTSPGPVFFVQTRTGRGGQPFRMVKFRTMSDGAENERMALADHNELSGGPLFKIRNDPRVTPLGKVLRKYSLDELPQLFNVLAGTMSLVGPRPFVVHEADKIQGWSRRRLDLTPGMTGLWQVSGRNDVSYEEMIRLDYLYVTNWSPLWDLRIMLETIPRVILGRGAS